MIWQATWPILLASLPAAIALPAWWRSANRPTVSDYLDSGWALPAILSVVLAVLFAAVTIGVNGIGASYERRQCDRYGDAMRVTTTYERWSWWAWDCFVDVDGTRVTLDRYLAVKDVQS